MGFDGFVFLGLMIGRRLTCKGRLAYEYPGFRLVGFLVCC